MIGVSTQRQRRTDMVSRILPVTLFAALGLLLAWPATDVQAQARGGGRNNLFQYDASHPAYKDIQREESLGQEHIDGPVDYGTDFPTSGPHAPRPTRAGFYDEPVALEALVHAMEHGSVIVYYDKPGDAAMKLMIEGGFQEEREAAGKWVRAQLTSAQLSTYFVGYQEHLEMRAAVENAWGDEFTLRRYHDEALSYGSPPVRYVQALMLDDEIPGRDR